MPALRVDNAAILTLKWNQGLTNYVNVLGVSCPPNVIVNQTLANTVGAAVKSALTSSGLIAQLHTNTALNKVGIRDIRATNLVEFIDSGGALACTGTGDPLPLQVALVVTLRTAKAGQSFRGRVFLAGYTEAVNDTSHNAVAAAGTASVAFIVAVQNALKASGMDLGVLSRPAEKKTITTEIVHSDGTTSTEVSSTGPRAGSIQSVIAVELRNSTWDTQRRRAAPGSASTFFGPLISTSTA